MTVSLTSLIGRLTLVQGLDDKDFAVQCLVADARELFGRREVLVRPVKGSGSRWVNVSRTDLESK